MVSLVSERRAAVWVPVLVFRLLIGVCPAVMGSGCVWAEDLRGWRPLLSSQSVLQQEAERVVLQGSEWTWLVSPERRMLPVVIECSCRRSIRSVHWCGIRTADMC